jgi:hypothetical protein
MTSNEPLLKTGNLLRCLKLATSHSCGLWRLSWSTELSRPIVCKGCGLRCFWPQIDLRIWCRSWICFQHGMKRRNIIRHNYVINVKPLSGILFVQSRPVILWPFERLLASQQGICPMESGSSLETSSLDEVRRHQGMCGVQSRRTESGCSVDRGCRFTSAFNRTLRYSTTILPLSNISEST